MSVLTRLVEIARRASIAPDTDPLRTRLLYNCAAALGNQHETRRICRALAGESGAGCTAFHLAAAMHARTQDDFHPAGRVHVGAVVIPAVLTVGRGDILPAMSAGYEITTSVAEAYSDIAQARGYRPTGIFGPLGAAAAAAVALDLDDVQLASAMAIASTSSAGTNQSWLDGTDEWLVEVASAARAGVDAARFAAAGLRGAPSALEGRAGWGAAFFGDTGAAALQECLDRDVSPSSSVAIKLYPVSGIAQVPTYLAAELGRQLRHAPPQCLQVQMSPGELRYPGSRNKGPFVGRSDSLMSVARCVALAYAHGSVTYQSLLNPPGPSEESILARLDLMPDEQVPETEAIVSVTVGGQVSSTRGRADQLLYPPWPQSRDSVHEIATRTEARADVLSEVADVVSADVDADAVLALIGGHHDD